MYILSKHFRGTPQFFLGATVLGHLGMIHKQIVQSIRWNFYTDNGPPQHSKDCTDVNDDDWMPPTQTAKLRTNHLRIKQELHMAQQDISPAVPSIVLCKHFSISVLVIPVLLNHYYEWSFQNYQHFVSFFTMLLLTYFLLGILVPHQFLVDHE